MRQPLALRPLCRGAILHFDFTTTLKRWRLPINDIRSLLTTEESEEGCRERTDPTRSAPLILCRDVLPDPNRGNVHLIGVCDAIRPQNADSYPHRHPILCAFVQLADAQGDAEAYVRIIEAETQELVFETRRHRLRFPHRRFVVRANFRMVDCVFPRPGVYWIELYVKNRWLTDQTLRLLESGE